MQQETDSMLPVPDTTSAAHSARVGDFIRNEIAAAGGLISFAEFMHLALYAPGLGYYNAGTIKFGGAGDFITAPEVSAVFGRLLARQCASVLAELDAPSILEFGAGSGKLAADILQALAELDAVPHSYRILEVSADLRERQESLLRSEVPELADRVTWLHQLPDEHTGVIIANEVIDAMPVERFSRNTSGIAQHCVGIGDDGFVIEQRPAPDVLAAAVTAIEADLGRQFPLGYVSEVCLAAPGWIGDLAQLLKRGVAFLFDYGVSRREYYAEDRSQGWLRCHFRQRAHNDPLILPGIQDLTAWVDFSAIATAAVDHGLAISGFVTQAQFLINSGLAEELAGLTELPLEAQLRLSGEVKLLTMPGEMGENFKCLGLHRGMDLSLSAFAIADRTAAL